MIRLLCCICKQGIAREIGQDLEGPAGYSFEQGENMKIAMVGSGYVGLVSGACFADFGHDVVCIDKDQSKIDRLNDGIMPIYEPGLADLVTSNAKVGRLTFTASLAEGIKGANAISSLSALLVGAAMVMRTFPSSTLWPRRLASIWRATPWS